MREWWWEIGFMPRAIRHWSASWQHSSSGAISNLWVLSLIVASPGHHTQFTFRNHPCLGTDHLWRNIIVLWPQKGTNVPAAVSIPLNTSPKQCKKFFRRACASQNTGASTQNTNTHIIAHAYIHTHTRPPPCWSKSTTLQALTSWLWWGGESHAETRPCSWAPLEPTRARHWGIGAVHALPGQRGRGRAAWVSVWFVGGLTFQKGPVGNNGAKESEAFCW